MKYFVTGGLGFIGSNLSKRLLNEGHKVTIIDSLSDQIHGEDAIDLAGDFKMLGAKVIIDDVLFSGRTIRAGLDALLAFGRPNKVELLTLIDRRFTRHLPIQADYVGKVVDTLTDERVSVEWKEVEGEDKVVLFKQNNANG